MDLELIMDAEMEKRFRVSIEGEQGRSDIITFFIYNTLRLKGLKN